jgi:hypothetical protein
MGFSCFGGVNDTTPFGIWAAGGSAFEYPAGKGFELPPNRAFVMQIHYSGQDPGPDLTTVNLKLESAADEVEIFFISSISMSIAQGLVNYRADGDLITGIPVNSSGELVIPAGLRVRLIATFPHMHKLGKAMDVKFVKYGSVAQPQTDVCLAEVTNWNFNWQDTYIYKEPILLRPGTYKPQITCYYDSTRNWPVGRTAPITFGENSDEEMCMAFFHYTIEYDI